MLLATWVQWFQAEHEALRAFWGLKLLLLSFSFFSFLWNRWGETCTSSPFSSRLQWRLTFSYWIALCFCSTCISFPQKISQPVQFQVKHKALHAQKAHPARTLARSFPAPRPLSLSQLKEAGTYTVKCSLDSQDRLSKCVCEIPHPFEMRGDLLEHGPLRDSETFSLLFSSPPKPFISLPPLTRSRSLSLRLLFASLCWAITAQTEKWGSSAAVSVFLISFGKDDVFEWVRYPRSGAVERLILKYE